MDQQVKKSAFSYKDDYFDKALNAKITSQQRKQEAFEKFRPIFERVRERRRIPLLLKSGSKITPKKLTLGRMPTPLRICQNTIEKTGTLVLSRSHQHSRNDLENMLSRGCKSSQRLNDVEESNVASEVSSQECCRALEFESGDEGDDPDDHTTPLKMMDITNMIRGASILQAPYQEQQQPKENHQPIMKKNPVSITNTSSLKKTTYNRRNEQNKSDGSQFNVNSKPEKKVVFKTCLEVIHDQSSQVDIPMNKSLSHQTIDISLGNVDEVKKNNFDAHHVGSVDSSKNERYEKEQKATRKILRGRRSSVTSCIRTLSSRIPQDIPNFKRASNLPKTTHVYPHIGKPLQKKSQIPVNQLASSHTSTTRVDQKTEIPRICVISVNDTKTKDEEADEENMIICKDDKCDASTNTTVRFVCGHSPDALLSSEVEKLVEEQDQIDKKAKFFLEQTLSRNKQMKESGLMESFCTSISPMRRLQALLKEKEENSTSDYVSCTSDKLEEDSSGYKSFQLCETSVFKETHSTPENNNADCVIPDTNIPDNSSLNTADELNATHLHWNHLKQDNRFFQTPSSVTVKRFITQRTAQAEDEENLFKSQPGNASPFAQLVGDCERPSLAPMTPHSRYQILQLKTCLKKQLEQLYD